MQTSINFYELKTQLADQGFHEPTIIDQLREALFTEYYYASLYIDRGLTHFQLNLEKNVSGNLVFQSYDAIATAGSKFREQVFAPDVPIGEAVSLMRNRLQRTEVDVTTPVQH